MLGPNISIRVRYKCSDMSVQTHVLRAAIRHGVNTSKSQVCRTVMCRTVMIYGLNIGARIKHK